MCQKFCHLTSNTSMVVEILNFRTTSQEFFLEHCALPFLSYLSRLWVYGPQSYFRFSIHFSFIRILRADSYLSSMKVTEAIKINNSYVTQVFSYLGTGHTFQGAHAHISTYIAENNQADLQVVGLLFKR